MEKETSFIDTILLSLTSNAIWALLGVGIIYSIYCRLKLQKWIKKTLLKQAKHLTSLQNNYINAIKLDRLSLETYYPDGLQFLLPPLLEEAEEIKYYGNFSRWALLGETRSAFRALCNNFKRYESKVNAIHKTPSTEESYALLCIGMNIYYQMITISKDWANYTPIGNDIDDFTKVVSEYFGVVLDREVLWCSIAEDINYNLEIGVARDVADL